MSDFFLQKIAKKYYPPKKILPSPSQPPILFESDVVDNEEQI